MKKTIGIQMPLYPAPVLIIGNYDEKGKPNVMTAAWEVYVALCLLV